MKVKEIFGIVGISAIIGGLIWFCVNGYVQNLIEMLNNVA